MPVGVEYVDKAVAGTCHIVMLCGILQRIGHKEIAVDVLDAERGVAGRDVGIFEPAIGGYQFIVVVEDIDRATAKVGREEKDSVDVGAENEPSVDRAICRIGSIYGIGAICGVGIVDSQARVVRIFRQAASPS